MQLTKKCSKCGDKKPLKEFYKDKNRKDGRNTYCKICAVEVSKQWYKDNVNNPKVKNRLTSYYRDRHNEFKEFVNQLKKSLGCLVCEEVDICCLDFHHLANKKDDIYRLKRAKNRKALIEELKKCVCVCANCHRKIHAVSIKLHSDLIATGMQMMYCSLHHVIKKTNFMKKPR